MLRLEILSGRRAGEVVGGRKHFLTVGRAPGSDVVLDDPGVWPAHGKISWNKSGVAFEAAPDALASLNGAAVTAAPVRNGDILTLGAVNLRLAFAPVRQVSLRLVEWTVWISFVFLAAVETGVIYWLARP